MQTQAQLLRLRPLHVTRPSYETIRIIINSHLEALDKINQLQESIKELRRKFWEQT